MVNRQRGFTLIELIIVIVILGVLSVTAAPKFLNIQDDAIKSTLKGIDGSLNSTMSIILGKSIVSNVDKKESAKIDDINIGYGYPLATEDDIEAAMDINIDIDGNGDFSYMLTMLGNKDGIGGVSNSIVMYPNGKVKDDNCFIAYIQADETTPASTMLELSGC